MSGSPEHDEKLSRRTAGLPGWSSITDRGVHVVASGRMSVHLGA